MECLFAGERSTTNIALEKLESRALTVLLSLVRSSLVLSSKSDRAVRTLVRLKSVVSVQVASKIGFAGEDLAAGCPRTYVLHEECR